MICPKCNKMIKDGSKFCGHCGADITLAKYSITNNSTDNIVERGYEFLSQGSFNEARELFNKALSKSPNNVRLLIGMLLCDLKLKNEQEIAECNFDFRNNNNYQALQAVADENTKSRFCKYQEEALIHKELSDKKLKYDKASSLLNGNNFEKALAIFEELNGWQDSKEKIALCKQSIEKQRIEKEKEEEEIKLQNKLKVARIKKYAIIFVVALAVLVATIFTITNYVVPLNQYNEAISLLDDGQYERGYAILSSLGSFKDSAQRIKDSKYERAITLIQNGEYEAGYALLRELGTYKNAGDYIIDDIHNRAIQLLSNNDYKSAYELLIGIDSENAEIIKTRKEAYKGLIFSKLTKYDDTNDLEGAILFLGDELPNKDADQEVIEKLEAYKNSFRSKIISDASTAFANSGYSAAISTVEKGLTILAGDQELKKKKSEYEEYIPVNLFELNYQKGSEKNYSYENGPEEAKDCDGNTYSNCYEMHTSMDQYAYLVFDLDKKYSKFTGTFFWSSEHGRSQYYNDDDIEELYIYNADNDKLLYKVTLNCNSKAVSFSIDVTGINKLHIGNYCSLTNNSFADSTYCLSDFKVQK